jgi:Domain of unknown function (DUF4381)
MRRRLFGIRVQTSAALIALIVAASASGVPVAEDIRDIRGPKYLLPNWVLPALVAGAVLVALSIYGLWRWRRKRAVRIWLPYEIALQRLDEIRTLMQPASAREFSTAVSDIVRRYIEQRFDVTATRRTTEEFLRDLLESSTNASLARHQGLLGEFLQQCDFVKFAALALTLQNMESLRQSARAFVLATVQPEETAAAEKTHDSIPAT